MFWFCRSWGAGQMRQRTRNFLTQTERPQDGGVPVFIIIL